MHLPEVREFPGAYEVVVWTRRIYGTDPRCFLDVQDGALTTVHRVRIALRADVQLVLGRHTQPCKQPLHMTPPEFTF